MDWKKAIHAYGSLVCNNSSPFFFGIILHVIRYQICAWNGWIIYTSKFFKPSPNINYV